MASIYILYSYEHHRFYIGSVKAKGAEARLKEHNRGKTKSTKAYTPWTLVYEEKLSTYTEARQRENFLKSGQGRKWIREEWQRGHLQWMPGRDQGMKS